MDMKFVFELEERKQMWVFQNRVLKVALDHRGIK
jgi:hypothetical protein